MTKRLARREAIAIIVAAVVLLGAMGWLAMWGTTWSPRAVLRGQGDTWPLGFTPDGKSFATSGTGGITIWDTAQGRRGSSGLKRMEPTPGWRPLAPTA